MSPCVQCTSTQKIMVHINKIGELKNELDSFQMRKLLTATLVVSLLHCRSESVILSSLFAFALIIPLRILLFPTQLSNLFTPSSFLELARGTTSAFPHLFRSGGCCCCLPFLLLLGFLAVHDDGGAFLGDVCRLLMLPPWSLVLPLLPLSLHGLPREHLLGKGLHRGIDLGSG